MSGESPFIRPIGDRHVVLTRSVQFGDRTTRIPPRHRHRCRWHRHRDGPDSSQDGSSASSNRRRPFVRTVTLDGGLLPAASATGDAAGSGMRGQRVRSAVAPALAPAVARTLALGCRHAARNHAPSQSVLGAPWAAAQDTGEGGATPPFWVAPRPGSAERGRPVGSLPLRPRVLVAVLAVLRVVHRSRLGRGRP
jgi:hypothetical protein